MALNYINLQLDYFSDTSGKVISNGFIYIGQPGLDPEILANRVTVTLIQEDGTQVPILPASQPLTTGPGGRLSYLGSPVQATVAQDYSIKVVDSNNITQYNFSNLSNTHPAAQITYDNGASGLVADDVQEAIDELAAQTASDIPYDNSTSGLPGSNVQDAIDDLTDSNNIGYDNTLSGLASLTVQDAIDELKAITASADDSGLSFDNASFYIWQRGTTITQLIDNMNGADRWQLGEENTVNDTTMVMNRLPNPDVTGLVKSKYVAHVEFQIITGGTNPFLGQRIYDPYFLSGKTVTFSMMINNNSGSTVSCQSRIMPDGVMGAIKVTGTTYIIQAAAGYVLYETTIVFPVFQNANITNDFSNWIVCPLHVPGIGASVDIEIADMTMTFGNNSVGFSPCTYKDELSECIPLYESGGLNGSFGWSGSAASAFVYYARTTFTEQKRFTPVVTLNDAGGSLAFNPTSGTVIVDVDGIRENRTATVSNDQARFQSSWIADSEILGTGI